MIRFCPRDRTGEKEFREMAVNEVSLYSGVKGSSV